MTLGRRERTIEVAATSPITLLLHDISTAGIVTLLPRGRRPLPIVGIVLKRTYKALDSFQMNS
jgi:hypothetical protein